MPRVCPNCESQDVKPDSSALPLHGSPTDWECNNCGYSGPMPEQ